jgi:hypothetical protein
VGASGNVGGDFQQGWAKAAVEASDELYQNDGDKGPQAHAREMNEIELVLALLVVVAALTPFARVLRLPYQDARYHVRARLADGLRV